MGVVNNFLMKKRKFWNLEMQIIGKLFVILHAEIEVGSVAHCFQ